MIKPNVILVTGTSRGIGRYLADYYCEKGFQVIGVSRKVCDIKRSNYDHFIVDIGDDVQVKNMFKRIKEKYFSINVLINNAAIPASQLLMLIPDQMIKSAYSTNVLGMMTICRESIKLMIKNNFGRIINLSSMAVKHELMGDSIYASSKAAVNTFTRVLAKEVYHNGITCNVVAPSAIKTDLSANMNQDVLFNTLQRNIIHEYGTMADVSNVTDWLIKAESSAITGQIIYLGGA